MLQLEINSKTTTFEKNYEFKHNTYQKHYIYYQYKQHLQLHYINCYMNNILTNKKWKYNKKNPYIHLH